MGTSLIGQTLDAVDTPALLVDLSALDANIQVMTGHLRSVDCGWRPHAKAHKSPAIAHRLLKAGAIGITCAKTSEAEVYAAAGIPSILIANQVVGPLKTRRLAWLAHQADIIVSIDNLENALMIDAAAADAGSSPRAVVEVNSGMNRAGVAPGNAALSLAREIAGLSHLRFAGFMTWEGHVLAIRDAAQRETAVREALAPVLETADRARSEGLAVEIVSCGGTGTFLTTAGIEGVKEVEAGGGIFGDRFYRELDVPVRPALSMLVSVTSRPTPDRIIVDAGRKAIDPSNTLPEWPELPDIVLQAYSAEHGTLTLGSESSWPEVGDRLRMNIGYSDQAIHLHRHLIALQGDRVAAIWPTLARGCLA